MSQYVQAVCRAMERIAPLRLAESWDNVGLLLEAPPVANAKSRVLLTIDLTPNVAQEALASEASMIIAYHPPIFRPLSSLTLSNPLQRSLLRLTQAGVSIYSPHTALDSVNGGVNDWLAEAFFGNQSLEAPVTPTYLQDKNDDAGGGGRLVTLPHPGMSINEVIERVKRHLGINQVQVAKPYDTDRNVQTVAICAGSGGSMFQGVDADLYFTGEMQHHDVLAAQAMNRYVLLCGHTNTERGYLKVLKEKLLAEWAEERDGARTDVQISQADAHPLVAA